MRRQDSDDAMVESQDKAAGKGKSPVQKILDKLALEVSEFDALVQSVKNFIDCTEHLTADVKAAAEQLLEKWNVKIPDATVQLYIACLLCYFLKNEKLAADLKTIILEIKTADAIIQEFQDLESTAGRFFADVKSELEHKKTNTDNTSASTDPVDFAQVLTSLSDGAGRLKAWLMMMISKLWQQNSNAVSAADNKVDSQQAPVRNQFMVFPSSPVRKTEPGAPLLRPSAAAADGFSPKTASL